jgi:hypothetical protein
MQPKLEGLPPGRRPAQGKHIDHRQAERLQIPVGFEVGLRHEQGRAIASTSAMYPFSHE